ncbi:glycosyltransferase family 4 protein [Chryseobacterium sp. DT-3]|uniref:glycosyltransferase family 4 protein n=1 Tax=Chryseobacterium sp. DT-3 TaxID=3396164 RepID=UPI003F1D80C4
MKILIISQYFWPESFKINDIALGLKELGHEVSILTGLPNYPSGTFYDGYSIKSSDEEWNGIKIYRSKLFPRGKGGVKLFINYFSFVIFGWLKIKKINKKFDRILVYEPSPITVGIPAIKAAKKFHAPYYFWVQDLWPESLTAAGGVKNKYVLSFFDKITRLIYSKAEKILVQSPGFKEYIKNQGVPEDKIIFYPNTTEGFYKKEEPIEEIEKLLSPGFRIIFAGNLGEAQSLETLIEAAAIVKQKISNIKWFFLGNGRAKEALEKNINYKKLEDNVFLLGSYPAQDMPKFFASADALMVSLKKDKIFALTIPSKIQSYLACAKPILASLDGEGAKIINDAKCGFASPSEDANTLAENVIKLYNLSNTERERMGSNAEVYFKTNFERNKLLKTLVDIMK